MVAALVSLGVRKMMEINVLYSRRASRSPSAGSAVRIDLKSWVWHSRDIAGKWRRDEEGRRMLDRQWKRGGSGRGRKKRRTGAGCEKRRRKREPEWTDKVLIRDALSLSLSHCPSLCLPPSSSSLDHSHNRKQWATLGSKVWQALLVDDLQLRLQRRRRLMISL